MGNTQARSTTPFRQSLLKHSVKRTVAFEFQHQLTDYLVQLNRRMTLRTTYIPRLIYYQTLPIADNDFNRSPPKFQVDLYFQQIGQTDSSQLSQMSVSSCKCEELITALRELRFRFGNFALTLRQVFFSSLSQHPTSLWISPQIQACQPAIKVSEREMCESIVRTFCSICQKRQCIHTQKWRNQYVLKFQELIKAIKSPTTSVINPRIPTQTTQERPRELPWKTSGRSKTSPSQEVSHHQPQYNPLSIVKQQPPQASHLLTFNQLVIPHLDCVSAESYSQNSANNTDRLRSDPQPQIKEMNDYMIKQDSLGFLTTARTPRINYIMRRSSELTIFPNQYQQKFQKIHQENCKGQPSARFLTFRNAMQTLKAKTEKEIPSRFPQKSFTKYDPSYKIRQQPSISSFQNCPIEAQ